MNRKRSEGFGTRPRAKLKSGDGRSVQKADVAAKDVDAYLAAVPEPTRGTLMKVRAAVRSAAPAEATEGISYGIPCFKYKGILVWFAAFAKHCSFFPTAAVIESFKTELKGYVTSKGTIQFPIDKPLPTALVKKMVKARVAQNETKNKH